MKNLSQYISSILLIVSLVGHFITAFFSNKAKLEQIEALKDYAKKSDIKDLQEQIDKMDKEKTNNDVFDMLKEALDNRLDNIEKLLNILIEKIK